MGPGSQFRISAKNLGELALSDFCPRCFWLKLHIRQLPFQIFPGDLQLNHALPCLSVVCITFAAQVVAKR